MGVKEYLIRNAVNAQSYKTGRKIIVFESDDWGSIRMPSKSVYETLRNKGIGMDRYGYGDLDSLENKSDMTNLLEVLSGYRDERNNPALFTLNTVLTNPDFDKIRRDQFNTYHYEHFYDSYKNYYGEDLKPVWRKGMLAGLIVPQFHAREHINIGLWLKDLKAGNAKTRTAFDYGFFGLKTRTSSAYQPHYLGACWSEGQQDLLEKLQICKEGLDMFRSSFGFESRSMIACNYIWPVEMEAGLYHYGIQYLQGQRAQIAPGINGKCRAIYHRTGQWNAMGQAYLVRNCLFEPYSDPKKDWSASCMQEIANSFYWKTPAIISTHRINYVSNMDVKSRDNNLSMLRDLLHRISEKWPEVEFMSSDMLGDLLSNRTEEDHSKPHKYMHR